MNPAIDALQALSSAEEIFAHFNVPFDPAVLNVSRLHILKRFNQYLARAQEMSDVCDGAAHEAARNMLARAYADFCHSSAIEQKVFKVHQACTAAGRGMPIRWAASR